MRTKLRFITILSVVLVVGSLLLFVEGVRGTDQYWYLADVETLANDLPPLTNTIFPGTVLRAASADQATYFAHNGPLLHIVSWVSSLIGPVAAWKYLNILFFLLAAMLTGLTVARLSNVLWGYTSSIIFLLTPIHIWLAGNFLQEMFFCFLSAAVLFSVVAENLSRFRIVLLLGALAIGALSHPMYLVVGGCYSVYTIAYRRKWLEAALVMCSVLVAYSMKNVWFPTSMPTDIKTLVSASVPGVSNTVWQLSDTVPAISVELMWEKLKYALNAQFVPSSQTPIYLVTNVGLVALVALLCSFRRHPFGFLFACALFMISYGCMIVLTQNQIRYQLLITPAAIACTVLWVTTWRRLRLGVVLLILLLLGYLAIDVTMIRKLRIDSRTEQLALAELSEQLAFIPPTSRVAMVGNNLGGWLSVIYTLRPVRSMPVLLNVLDDGKFEEVLRLFSPDYILVRDGLSMDEFPEYSYIMSLDNVGMFKLDVYEMDMTNK